MNLNTASVSMAVTPTVVSTFLSHYLNRKPLRQRPTAHLSYDEGLHLIRSFLAFASHHTVEELQAFTAQWVPHPQWVKVEEVKIPDDQIAHAAAVLEAQLGPDGVRKVGGRKWWQWRKPNSPLKAEWIEMRSDYNERKRNNDPGRRVMLYVHGGAYFFGSVDEHRYQMQRHARKLKARVFAPRYRLSPQFPFPCGLQDCLAAYLHLLTIQDPSTIILAGDSAGGGMVVSMLVALRDQGIPLPAGAVLISPWVDLTHSFPSVAGEAPFDYIPQSGFHHKPSPAWPPPNEHELDQLKKLALEEKRKKSASANSKDANAAPSSDEITQASTRLHLTLDGKDIEIEEQIQMYTTNELLSHPLVSPVMQPSLGGLPPLLIMVGGGEILRDEQIYLAHKCANPSKYLPADSLMDEKARAQVKQYKPTDVHLQVWDDLCHVAPTLSFTRPAKYMYRSIAQFGAWALARAQKTEIDILDDDQISIISSSDSDDSDEAETKKEEKEPPLKPNGQIGKAGDPLPPFKNHMIRQRVTRHGVVFPLAPASELPGCIMANELVGIIKQGPVRKWLDQKQQWDVRFSSAKKKVHKRFVKDLIVGYEGFGAGEFPPPSALAGRRKIGAAAFEEKKKTKSIGLALWSLWGSKHDEMTVVREQEANKEPEVRTATGLEGEGARAFKDIQRQDTAPPPNATSRSRSRRRTVVDEHQTEADENTSVAELLKLKGGGKKDEPASKSKADFLSPDYKPDIGISGKRPYVDGIAVPFSLNKEAETASMLTLTSNTEQASRTVSPMPRSPDNPASPLNGVIDFGKQDESEVPTPIAVNGAAVVPEPKRPGMETFVTAAEELPKASASKNDESKVHGTAN